MIDARIHGIPCKIDVIEFDPGRDADLSGHPDTWQPPEPGTCEYEVCDRKGRPAPWLEAKLNDGDRRAIEARIHDNWENAQAEAKALREARARGIDY